MTDFEYEKCKTILDYYKGTHDLGFMINCSIPTW